MMTKPQTVGDALKLLEQFAKRFGHGRPKSGALAAVKLLRGFVEAATPAIGLYATHFPPSSEHAPEVTFTEAQSATLPLADVTKAQVDALPPDMGAGDNGK